MFFEKTRGRSDFYEIIFMENLKIHLTFTSPCRMEQAIASFSLPLLLHRWADPSSGGEYRESEGLVREAKRSDDFVDFLNGIGRFGGAVLAVRNGIGEP